MASAMVGDGSSYGFAWGEWRSGEKREEEERERGEDGGEFSSLFFSEES